MARRVAFRFLAGVSRWWFLPVPLAAGPLLLPECAVTDILSETAYFPALLTRPRLVHLLVPDQRQGEELSVVLRLEGFDTALSPDARAFFAAASRRVPDAALMAAGPGGGETLRLLDDLREGRFRTRVFVLAPAPDLDFAVAAVKAGATDVFVPPLDYGQMVAKLRAALRANMALHPESPAGVVPAGLPRLTPREREVLDLISNGLSNKEAGRQLGISPRTIEVHRARIMEKLGARNTADLLRILLTG